ncbi:MAG: hypothetical protein H0S82_04460 [Anaerolineaceae bacterium]|nr:hypothetical protein [Anaerolineaceae bacterium]
MTLQILQVSLFAIPVTVLIVLGLVILLRPVAVINRRWLLLTFLPLLAANLLAIVTNDTANGVATLPDWRFWANVTVDLALAAGISFWLRGFAVYGLPLTTVETLCRDALIAQGIEVSVRIGEKRTLLTTERQATIFSVNIEGKEEEIWLTSRTGEVVIQADSAQGKALAKQILPLLRNHQTPYAFQHHAVGILYLVLAVVLLVLGWIYFFEPRLVVVE